MSDKPIKSYSKCDLCGGYIKYNIWMGEKYRNLSMKSHRDACERKTKDEREAFVRTGKWPKGAYNPEKKYGSKEAYEKERYQKDKAKKKNTISPAKAARDAARKERREKEKAERAARDAMLRKLHKEQKKGEEPNEDPVDPVNEAIDELLLVDEDSLLEASLSRVQAHFNTKEFVIFSAWRATDRLSGREVSREQNIKNTNHLTAAIRSEGLGYIRVEGFGQETDPDTGLLRAARESSFLVVNERSGGRGPHPDFLPLMFRLAQINGPNFAQEFLLHHTPDSGSTIYNVSTGQPDMKLSNFAVGASQFYSMLHNRENIRAKWADKNDKLKSRELDRQADRIIKSGSKGRIPPSKSRSFHVENVNPDIATILKGKSVKDVIEGPNKKESNNANTVDEDR